MSAYSDPEYQRNRKRLLADQPPCAWCGKQATTADHLVEVDRGGSNQADNLVPACSACNSKRGSIYQARKVAQRQHIRREALRDNGRPIGNEKPKTQNEKTQNGFFTANTMTLPTPHYYEETWCSYLARHRGYNVVYDGSVSIGHSWHASSPKPGEGYSHADAQFKVSQSIFRNACDQLGIERD